MLNENYMNSQEAAEYLQLSDRTVRTLCQNRKIRHERLNERNFRFKKQWLDEYLQSIVVEPVNTNSEERKEE